MGLNLPQFQTQDKNLTLLQTTWASALNKKFSSVESAANFGAGLFILNFGQASGSASWTVTNSATIIDFTVVGTPDFTTIYSSGFTGLSALSTGLPGVTFTAPNAGTIAITAEATANLNAAHPSTILLTDSDNTVLRGSSFYGDAAGQNVPMILMGYMPVKEGVTYSVKLRGSFNPGVLTLGGIASDYLLSFSAEYVA